MKVVINACYGGFSLSYQACMLYAKLKGIKLYASANAEKNDGSPDFKKYIPYDGKGNPFIIFYSTSLLSKDGTHKEKCYWSDRDLERHDPFLVKVVEQLKYKANGSVADLKIVEIPDGTKYEIEEYDGVEWVSEKHRTWR